MAYLLQHHAICFLPAFETADPEKFVGGVDIFILQAKGKIHHMSSQEFQKHTAHRYGTPHSGQIWFLAVQRFQRTPGGLICRMIKGHQVWVGTAGKLPDENSCACRCMGINVGDDPFNNFIGLLIRYQPTCNLGMRFTRDDSFDAFSLESSPDSIHFQMDGGMSRDPLVESEKSGAFFDQVQDLSRNLDVRITREHRWSSAEICYVDPLLPVLDGYGPIGQKLQDRSEYILRHSLLERALLIAITLKELSKV